VKGIFENLEIGEVERVDMVKKTNAAGKEFNRVFVHFKHWNDNESANAVKEKLLSGDSVKIVYDDPWFWKIFKSNVEKPVFEKRPRESESANRLPKMKMDENLTAAEELKKLRDILAAQSAQMEELQKQVQKLQMEAEPVLNYKRDQEEDDLEEGEIRR